MIFLNIIKFTVKLEHIEVSLILLPLAVFNKLFIIFKLEHIQLCVRLGSNLCMLFVLVLSLFVRCIRYIFVHMDNIQLFFVVLGLLFVEPIAEPQRFELVQRFELEQRFELVQHFVLLNTD